MLSQAIVVGLTISRLLPFQNTPPVNTTNQLQTVNFLHINMADLSAFESEKKKQKTYKQSEKLSTKNDFLIKKAPHPTPPPHPLRVKDPKKLQT
jgi:hypothetical protein